MTDNIILCTTTLEEDDLLCEIATSNAVKYYRGSSEDKLQRWNGACEEYGVEFFVNADGDDLFFDAGLADLCFHQQNSSDPDFIDGHGLYNDVYGIKAAALARVCRTKDSTDTEFVRPHFLNKALGFRVEKIANVPSKYKKRNIRMTLDYIEDYTFFKTIIERFASSNWELDLEKILSFLEENPEVVEINWGKEKEWEANQQRRLSKGATNEKS
jgi:spore coat polysaccharide biosynthesis protein SpsF